MNPGAWLCRVLKNLSFDMRRRHGPRLVLVGSPEELDDAPDTSERSDPEAQVVDEACIEATLDLFQRMPERWKRAVTLFYGAGFSVRETAEVLDVPENTVKVWLHRARKSLEASLRAQEWFGS